MSYTAIVDYGVGNLKSVSNALAYVGQQSRICADDKELELADAIILPGVGAFPDAARRLRQSGLIETLQKQALQKPILGICLGMQLLFQTGYEVRPSEGLGFVPGTVERIRTELKLPHIGWNGLKFYHDSPLFAGLDDGACVYFVHSFCGLAKFSEHVIATTDYGTEVTAAVQNGYVFGTQFHPEKSGEVGLQILKNFGELNR